MLDVHASLRPVQSIASSTSLDCSFPTLLQMESFQIRLEWGDIEEAEEEDGSNTNRRGVNSPTDVAAAATLMFPRRAFVTSTDYIWRLTCMPQSPGIAEYQYVIIHRPASCKHPHKSRHNCHLPPHTHSVLSFKVGSL